MAAYKFDPHIHTSETSPCGRFKGSELVHLYKSSGYSGLIITDHYYDDYFMSITGSWRNKVHTYLNGYRSAFEEGRKIGLTVLPGIELRFSDSFNDYLVYGIDEDFLIEYKELYKMKLEEFKPFSEKHGLLIYQAHPFRTWVTPADPKYLDGVEVYNGSPRHESRNHLALEFAQKNGLKMLSGSDFHVLSDLALGGILLSEEPKTPKEFVRQLNNNGITALLPE